MLGGILSILARTYPPRTYLLRTYPPRGTTRSLLAARCPR
jgi:hypothetical protein